MHAEAAMAHGQFFPPWYFWLFVGSIVLLIAAAVVAIVFINVQAETERRRHERETAARLIEVLVVQRKMSAEEVEQVINCYWQTGTFWSSFSRWFAARPGPHKHAVAKWEMT